MAGGHRGRLRALHRDGLARDAADESAGDAHQVGTSDRRAVGAPDHPAVPGLPGRTGEGIGMTTSMSVVTHGGGGPVGTGPDEAIGVSTMGQGVGPPHGGTAPWTSAPPVCVRAAEFRHFCHVVGASGRSVAGSR
jgi:hypothetical protein